MVYGDVAGAGVLVTLGGPGPIAAETSKDGYLRRDTGAIVDDLAFRQNVHTSEEEVEMIIKRIQRFDPCGVAARNLQECLVLQLLRQKEEGKEVDVAIAALTRYFDDFCAVDRIDLFQLHRIDPDVPEADQFGALEMLRREGKIRLVGLSEVGVSAIEPRAGKSMSGSVSTFGCAVYMRMRSSSSRLRSTRYSYCLWIPHRYAHSA